MRFAIAWGILLPTICGLTGKIFSACADAAVAIRSGYSGRVCVIDGVGGRGVDYGGECGYVYNDVTSV